MGFLTSQSATKMAKLFGFIACFFFVSAATQECELIKEDPREEDCHNLDGVWAVYIDIDDSCRIQIRDMERGTYIDVSGVIYSSEKGPYTYSDQCAPPRDFILEGVCLNPKGEQILKPGETPREDLKVQRLFEPGFEDACEAVGGEFSYQYPWEADCLFRTPDRVYVITRDINRMLAGNEQEIPEEFRDLCQAREDAFIIGTRCMDKNSGDVTSVIERIIDPVPPEAATAGRPENEGPQPSENEGPQPSENEGTSGETTRTCANSFPSEWWEANCA